MVDYMNNKRIPPCVNAVLDPYQTGATHRAKRCDFMSFFFWCVDDIDPTVQIAICGRDIR
jgi:hypothetical protein